jgi:uncharacterized protein YndB with AHSA1/START domain
LFGEVRITRLGYRAPGQDAIHPLDRELRLPGRIYSYECQRRLLRAVVCSPFGRVVSTPSNDTGGQPMMSGSQQIVDGRPALRFERRLSHAVERVWRAVTEPAELARWFVVSDVPWTPQAGEVFEAGGDTGRITELEPPRLIAWTWGDERYSFELTPDGDGCLLVFTHVFNAQLGPSWQHAAGWETYLNRLDAHLADTFLSEEDAHHGIDVLLARYRERFHGDDEAASGAAGAASR